MFWIDEAPLDLEAYLRRIDYRGDLAPTVENLTALHLAHATHIPFENLDVLLRRPIRLDLASLQKKLVEDCRGGYCFEQNLLFLTVLERLGFTVTPLAARVRYRTQRVLPKTHMALLVEVHGGRWLADVGFGGEGLLTPVPLVAEKVSEQFVWRYRVVPAQEKWILQSQADGQWNDLYVFDLERQHLIDYEMANFYVSTHPDSRFTHTLTVQQPTPETRYVLRNHEYVVIRPGSENLEPLDGAAALLSILAQRFGLCFPAGTTFPISDVVA